VGSFFSLENGNKNQIVTYYGDEASANRQSIDYLNSFKSHSKIKSIILLGNNPAFL